MYLIIFGTNSTYHILGNEKRNIEINYEEVYSMKWNKRIIVQNSFLFIICLMFVVPLVSCGNNSHHSLTTQKYIVHEKELIYWDTGYELDTALLGSGESIAIYYTVLAESTSSVRFTFILIKGSFGHQYHQITLLSQGNHILKLSI